MSTGRWAGGLVALTLVLSGCTRLAPVFHPAPWDAHGDAGPLAVRGAARDDPGPTIVRALRREPRLTAVLERYGEPDTVEVRGARFAPKQLVLVYRRTKRQLVLEPSSDGWVARAPETLPAPARKATTRPAPARTVEAGRPAPVPTMMQTLECPIDPTRDDCRALCVGARHEWCP